MGGKNSVTKQAKLYEEVNSKYSSANEIEVFRLDGSST